MNIKEKIVKNLLKGSEYSNHIPKQNHKLNDNRNMVNVLKRINDQIDNNKKKEKIGMELIKKCD